MKAVTIIISTIYISTCSAVIAFYGVFIADHVTYSQSQALKQVRWLHFKSLNAHLRYASKKSVRKVSNGREITFEVLRLIDFIKPQQCTSCTRGVQENGAISFGRTPNCRVSRINHMFLNTFPMHDN